MARWGDTDSWNGLVSGRTCSICVAGGPSHVIAELEGCWLTMADDQAPSLPGTCSLFVRRHAVELHDLSLEAATQFMGAAQRVSGHLAAASGAVKINYEIHGNTIPHLHMHFFPRYPGDPFEHRPIDPRQQGSAHDLAKHRAIRRQLTERLRSGF